MQRLGSAGALARCFRRPCRKLFAGVTCTLRECINQQVAAFLFVNPTEKKKYLLAAQIRKLIQELFARPGKIDIGCGRAVVHDHFVAAVWPERSMREPSFFFGGEKKSCGIAQNAMFDRKPVESF